MEIERPNPAFSSLYDLGETSKFVKSDLLIVAYRSCNSDVQALANSLARLTYLVDV